MKFPWKVGALLKAPHGGEPWRNIHLVVMDIYETQAYLLQTYTQKEKNEAYSPPWEGWIENSVAREWELERIA